MRNKDTYNPAPDTAAILDRAYAMIQDVDYAVSARWLFYRLLQEGYYSSKDDYASKWMKAVSRARHANYGGWRPDTLADETREAIIRGNGHDTPEKWLSALSRVLSCNLTKWHDQPYYVELWFEARAMIEQFTYYSDHVTLRPMGGQPSIPYKYTIAKDLEEASRRYDKPIVILYFGDLDPGGVTIESTIRDDVAKWCSVHFELIRCGLNPGQPEAFGIPDNPEKPGQYQWEALDDQTAKTLITESLAPYVRQDAFEAVQAKEDHVSRWLRAEIAYLIDLYPGAEA